MQKPGWQFFIDRGGTFTDIIAISPQAKITTLKLLSDNPEHYQDAALQGIRRLLHLTPDQLIPADTIQNIKMGTTVATNALLEHKGEPTVLAITQGFADALRIGYQNRPQIFALNIKLPQQLYKHVIEIQERIGAKGEIIRPIETENLEHQLASAYKKGLRALAVVCMHSYRYPAHEKIVATIAKKIGFTQISLSSQVAPMMKLVSRGGTTVVDAYLSPILQHYIKVLRAHIGDTKLLFMQSNGGLTDAQFFRGKNSILSGPAGGVVGMVATAKSAGFNKVIGFDMGGTSTDVAHYAGGYELNFSNEIAGVKLRAPMMAIHTIAAGGGSILHFTNLRYSVGPDSAGANPGPACYRRQGPLTITDCNVMLGKIQADFFPKIFGSEANQALDLAVVKQKFLQLTQTITQATGDQRSPEQVASAYLQVAVDNMANAIKKISIQKGYDINDYVLNCFGAASGQHACLVADALNIKTILIHPYAGLLSAYGMGIATQTVIHEQGIEALLTPDTFKKTSQLFRQLTKTTTAELLTQGVSQENIRYNKRIHLRYQGSDTSLIVIYAKADQIAAEFAHLHQQQFGFVPDDRPIVIESISLEASGANASFTLEKMIVAKTQTSPQNLKPHAIALVSMLSENKWIQTPVYQRAQLPVGSIIQGPAIIIENHATSVIEVQWQARVAPQQHLILTRSHALSQRVALGTNADPVMLEIFNNRFMAVAEQMGVVLRNTAMSVNIKERLDFSCAVFDAQGELIANAPHIPVHLGSMGESVKTIVKLRQGTMQPGDVYMLNAPYQGGTHLPDITVITPVFTPNATSDKASLLFFVASRGHHADIGGITPGSMPSNSQTICIVNALLGALGLLAASQGTCNNFTFGNAEYQYYETLCGGAGAGPNFAGTSAVHTHMTNTRLTDPEVLETRFPVLVEAFAVRCGSGGKGRYHGGDGIVRKIKFLAPLNAAIVSSHRQIPPFGLAGGKPGQPGKNWVIRKNSDIIHLNGCAQIEMQTGDVFVIETPGGGGYG